MVVNEHDIHITRTTLTYEAKSGTRHFFFKNLFSRKKTKWIWDVNNFSASVHQVRTDPNITARSRKCTSREQVFMLHIPELAA